MPVTITIDKPVYMDKLRDEFIAVGYRQFSSREGEFITVEDATDAAAIRAIYDAHNPATYDAMTAQALAARQTILNTAQSAVGVQLTALTAAQVRALMACMLYAAGGVDAATLTVKPLSEWMR